MSATPSGSTYTPSSQGVMIQGQRQSVSYTFTTWSSYSSPMDKWRDQVCVQTVCTQSLFWVNSVQPPALPADGVLGLGNDLNSFP